MSVSTPEASTSAAPHFELGDTQDAPMVVDGAVDEPAGAADEPAVVADKPAKAAKGKGKAVGPKKPVQSSGEPGKTVLPAVRALTRRPRSLLVACLRCCGLGRWSSNVGLRAQARVSRIIKADADVAMCGKEAVWLISKLTVRSLSLGSSAPSRSRDRAAARSAPLSSRAGQERFVQKLADASYTNARLGKRKRVQHSDVANVVRSTEAFSFLQGAQQRLPTRLTSRRNHHRDAAAAGAAQGQEASREEGRCASRACR